MNHHGNNFLLKTKLLYDIRDLIYRLRDMELNIRKLLQLYEHRLEKIYQQDQLYAV